MQICTVSHRAGGPVTVPRRLYFRVKQALAGPDGESVLRIEVDDETLLPGLEPGRLYAADIAPCSEGGDEKS